ncbi:MAG TPA: ABC transporter ATP-binding protein [Microthrixaceae bacterium]|nr:ABC transporter ATP-binding protein [Microthrixaceae bacterium]
MTYGNHAPVTALRSTDLTIRAGEHVAITGPSGSGKSTLLSLIGLLEPPTRGAVMVDGTNIAGIGSSELSRLRSATFGFVFQRFHLLPALTARANVELGLMYQGVRGSHRRAAAEAALERVGLGHRMTHLPSELSGGEQQRVAIARAVACDQPCLLADEPTGNLDSAMTAIVLDILDQIAASGTTVICVTHSEAVARRGTRRLVLDDGIVTSDRPPR